MKKYVAIGTACAALALTGCDGGKVIKAEKAPPTLESISAADWKAVSGKRIFFGHQSVGRNIIDGLKDIAREKGWAGLNIVETKSPAAAPGFYHAGIGMNGDPLQKIKDFESIVRGAGPLDVALMKFCYADIDAKTDVAAVFAAHRDAFGRLESDYPGTAFVRVTVPLEVRDGTLKRIIKRVIGRMTKDESDAVRERLNDMIRTDCAAGGKPLLDVALVESTAADLSRTELSFNGNKYYALLSEYSADGSHLNEVGRVKVAASLVKVLADLSSK